MKINRIFLSASIALAGLCASAQTAGGEVVEYTFQPHWYVQGQVGLQETLGEASFGRLASFNAQVAGGYNFSPVFGARLALNGWTSKAGMQVYEQKYKWKWSYLSPTVDLTVDLVNLLGGYNPERWVTGGVFAGVGANIAWNNGNGDLSNFNLDMNHANGVNAYLKNLVYADMPAGNRPNPLRNIWDGTKARFVGQFGVFADFKVAKRVKIGIELQANVLPDGYNSKKAGNADWYFNGYVGVKYTSGSGYKKEARKLVDQNSSVTDVVERIVEVPVEKIVVKEVIKEVPAPLTRNVFFKISKTVITKDQMYNVAEIASYLKANPDAKVTVTGYADKGTGSMSLNLRLAKERAQAVVEALTGKFGIDSSRIISKSMGEIEDQPYGEPELNRVSICVAE